MKKQGSSFLARWWVLITVIAVIAAIILFHLVGYRLGPGLSLVRVGTLVLSDLPGGASVYVDESYNRRAAAGDARITLLPGSHAVIVSVEGSQPWNELVTIAPDQETVVHPVIVPVKFAPKPVSSEDSSRAAQAVSKARIPTPASPLLMAGGCALVSVSGNSIIATASTTASCTPPPYLCSEPGCGPTAILNPTEKINAVLPYPGRDDVLVVSVGQTLFVLELDPRAPEFFAPILRGTSPRAAPWTDGSIVVYTGMKLYTVDL